MKKNFLLAGLMLAAFCTSFAQTAPDFTATDCRGNEYNLYSELAQGKVVLLVWVMPCTSCIGPALTAYNICESYDDPNIVYYLLDDVGNTPCQSLISWASNNGIGGNRIIFSTADIDQTNYGGSGMPHTAVIGPGGTIYFNGLNTDAGDVAGIQEGINSALLATGISEYSPNTFSLSVSPNPAAGMAMLQYAVKEKTSVSFAVVNETGQNVAVYKLNTQPEGPHQFQFDVSGLAPGNYFILLSAGQKTQAIPLVIGQ